MTDNYDVPYMERTRIYYEAQGYTTPYQWAHYDDAPFRALTKPLTKSRVSVVTTAMPDTLQGRAERKLYSNSSTSAPDSMFTLGLSWHDTVTHTRDVGSFLPIEALLAIQAEGGIGGLAPNFYSAPTAYSQRQTVNEHAPAILDCMKSEEVDVAILVPL
mgnify:CR=1 FL=1